MAYQLHKNQTILLFVILLALIALVVIAFTVTGDTGGDIIAKVIEDGGSPIYGTFENNISPWAVDAESLWWS